jgi:hypothetical protein
MNILESTGVGPVAKLIDTVVTRLFPDKTEQEKARLQLADLQDSREFQLLMGQIETNKEEAKHPSLFVSGWRPAVGWTCVVGLIYNVLAYPMLHWLSVNVGWQSPPTLDTAELVALLVALLGVSVPRTIERLHGKARIH